WWHIGWLYIQVFREFAEFSTIVNYDYEEEHPLPFPDVTVCSVNPLRKSALCAETFPGNLALPQEIRRRVCNDTPLFLNPNRDDENLLQKLRIWMARLKKNNFTNLRRLSNEFDKTVLDCSYAQKDCTNEKFFGRRLTYRYGICFCFHCNITDPEMEPFFDYHSTSSPNQGLELILDPQLDEYLPISTEVGFVVMVHGHGFRENVISDSDFVEPGYVTYIGLHMNKRTGLPEPYQKPCRSDYPRHLRKWVRNMTKYTKERAATC
ncbi:acid-sensing ion channel 4-B-like, partial [Ixodes scapularis]|uniref:acid-sensing ion channel 4-B-like n=1 Tax=Ixodes scapularis TaxID=6945 RepID=UPI001C38F5EE